MREAVEKLYRGLLSVLRQPGSKSGIEQRRLIRVQCDFEVRCVENGGAECSGRVVDLGLSGLRLITPNRLAVSSNLCVHLLEPILEVGENEQVFCKVRWCRRQKDGEHYEVGLHFLDTPGSARKSWIKFLLKEVGFDEQSVFSRRKLLRAGAAMPAELIGPDQFQLHGTVVNLGVGGCLLSLPDVPSKDELFDLRLGPSEDFKLLYLQGRVKQSQVDPAGQFLVGMQFEALSGAQIRLLGAYVLSLLKNSEAVSLV